MKKRIRYIGMLLVLFVLRVQAQYDPAFTNYWAVPSFYNPAATGQEAFMNVKAACNMQLSGFENAPSTTFAFVDMPLFFISVRHGVGLGFMNDKIGLFSHQKFYLQYAYHQPLWGGKLSAGVHLAMLNETFDGSELDLEESGDPAFPSSEAKGAGFDLNAGVQYARKSWFVGVAVMHCTSPTVSLGDDEVNEIRIVPTFYLMGGYNIKLKNPLYTIHTSAMLRSDIVGYRGDITGRMAYNGERYHLYGGLSYSPMQSVSLLFGGEFHGLQIGYAYEMYTSAIGALHGSHEIVLGYKTELDIFKRGKNKHKSVRLL